ncbi:hypothetical protein [Planococcus sp. ISL-109]|uniref:hypothetical protein n=1 Tax=Planococcus sp. ISL-109 TaxID=2819166 RepID=UPI001BE9A432|nr:hypothetical protein [Planococcus sp. ISL-109]MBT2583102.1 hypothetical protein [Planococcus sp. ISL-109]
MEKNQSTEVQGTVNRSMCYYEEYIAGYKLYKQWKKKWEAVANEETPDAIQ